METLPLDVFSSASNMAVVRAPGRKFPGMVVEGDSLWVLWDCARKARERLGQLRISDEELLGEVDSLLEELNERLTFNEEVLKEHGLEFPYSKR